MWARGAQIKIKYNQGLDYLEVKAPQTLRENKLIDGRVGRLI